MRLLLWCGLLISLSGSLAAQELDRIARLWQPLGPSDEYWEASSQTPGLMQPFEVLVLQFWATGNPAPTPPALPTACLGTQRREERPVPGGRRRETRMQLRASRHGSLQLGPGLSVYVPSELEGLAERDATEAIASPAPAPAGHWWWGGLVGGGLGLLALAWFLRGSGRSGHLQRAVPLPPHIEAARGLQRLRQAGGSEAEFFAAAAALLRRYLAARFAGRGAGQTTEELLAGLQAEPQLPRALHQGLANVLRSCDRVKFAALQPEPGLREEVLRIAEGLVEATRPDQLAEGGVPL